MFVICFLLCFLSVTVATIFDVPSNQEPETCNYEMTFSDCRYIPFVLCKAQADNKLYVDILKLTKPWFYCKRRGPSKMIDDWTRKVTLTLEHCDFEKDVKNCHLTKTENFPNTDYFREKYKGGEIIEIIEDTGYMVRGWMGEEGEESGTEVGLIDTSWAPKVSTAKYKSHEIEYGDNDFNGVPKKIIISWDTEWYRPDGLDYLTWVMLGFTCERKAKLKKSVEETRDCGCAELCEPVRDPPPIGNTRGWKPMSNTCTLSYNHDEDWHRNGPPDKRMIDDQERVYTCRNLPDDLRGTGKLPKSAHWWDRDMDRCYGNGVNGPFAGEFCQIKD